MSCTCTQGKKLVSKKFKTSLQDFGIHSSFSGLHLRSKEHWLPRLKVDN